MNFIALKENFCLGEKKYIAFSFKVINFIIKKSIYYFQINIDNAINHIGNIYCYYN